MPTASASAVASSYETLRSAQIPQFRLHTVIHQLNNKYVSHTLHHKLTVQNHLQLYFATLIDLFWTDNNDDNDEALRSEHEARLAPSHLPSGACIAQSLR